MKDDLDYYTNTYHIFTKAPDKLEEVLACPQVINWEQAFQIQGDRSKLKPKMSRLIYSRYERGGGMMFAFLLSTGCQESLGEAIQKVAASKSVQVDYLRTVLFVFEKPTLEASSGDKMDLMKLLKIPKVLEDKRRDFYLLLLKFLID